MSKTMGVSQITDTIYYGAVKNDMWVGKREDVTDEAIKAVFEWFMHKHKAECPDGAYEIHFPGVPYVLSMRKDHDLEEQGLLVKLPCKVGDSVFFIIGKDISKQKVKEIRIFDNRIEFVTSRRAFGIGYFGGNVFLTRKEDEEQLELLKVMYF